MNKQKIIKKYMADIGRKGGSSTSEAKQNAARANGSKPKKPRKVINTPL